MNKPATPEYTSFNDPAVNAEAITPGTTPTLGNFRALYVGGAGDISVEMALGGDTILFESVPAGTILPVSGKSVPSANTTATAIVALY